MMYPSNTICGTDTPIKLNFIKGRKTTCTGSKQYLFYFFFPQNATIQGHKYEQSQIVFLCVTE